MTTKPIAATIYPADTQPADGEFIFLEIAWGLALCFAFSSTPPTVHMHR